MRTPSHTLWLMRQEWRVLTASGRLLLAAALVLLLPALYAAIFLASVWDPAAHAPQLPVALVNLDRDVTYAGQLFNVGGEVCASLRERHTFGFVDLPTEAEARQQVREGRLAFALIFPPDFSSNALPGQQAGAGRLVVYTSEGNNYQSAQMARNFASELGHVVNENLNTRRWQLALNSAAGSARNVEQLRQSVTQLREGARELSRGSRELLAGARQNAEGAQRLREGVGEFSEGFRQLAAGVRNLEARRPRNSDLRRLSEGSAALVQGQTELGSGLETLRAGSARLRLGTEEFRAQANDSVLIPSRVVDGLDQLHGGIVQLDAGIAGAQDGQRQLLEGTQKLHAAVDELGTGLRTMNGAIRSAANRLPEDRQLDELGHGASALSQAGGALAEGTRKLQQGSERLTGGMDLLAHSLPGVVPTPDGSPAGLASSVVPVIEVDAPVPNSGSALAPNVLGAALWLGAGVVVFLVQVRLLPRPARRMGPVARLLGKLALPLMLALAQALLVFATARWALRLPMREPLQVALTMLLASACFVVIVFALIRALGDAGKALAMLLLALQLSSSGGVVPVELSGGLFADISPWMPLTWVVRGLKAASFGGYAQDWATPMHWLLGLLAMTLLLATAVGRWRYVRADQLRAALDL